MTTNVKSPEQLDVDAEEIAEGVDLVDLLGIERADAGPALPAFRPYVDDAAFRKDFPLALRALCGRDVPKNVTPYELVGVKNQLDRPITVDYRTGLPPDAFQSADGTKRLQRCRYDEADMLIRFTWAPGETKQVPTLILSAIWQIRGGEIVGGLADQLVLERGKMPEFGPGLKAVHESEALAKRPGPAKARS